MLFWIVVDCWLLWTVENLLPWKAPPSLSLAMMHGLDEVRLSPVTWRVYSPVIGRMERCTTVESMISHFVKLNKTKLIYIYLLHVWFCGWSSSCSQNRFVSLCRCSNPGRPSKLSRQDLWLSALSVRLWPIEPPCDSLLIAPFLGDC